MAVIELNEANFENEVEKNNGLVLVDFWASWCGPCRMLSPIVDEIAEERNDIKVCKINVDEEQALAARFAVMSIPTLILFKNGNIINKVIGVQPKTALLEMIENANK
ncbi:MAG: thioredoxin [Spirochaetales bacterium]|nr:thioredoxin [Spirochaetales bacterium]